MEKNKIGTIFLISALALAGIGISYAGFTDTVYVYGTVDTATVELDIEAYSGTWVWKIWDIQTGYTTPTFEYTEIDPVDEILIYRGWTFNAPTDAEVKAWANSNGGDSKPVSSAYAEAFIGADYDINMVYFNLFPCIDFTADFLLHYEGSIPVKVNVADIIMYTDWLEELYLAGGVTISAYRCTVPSPGQPIGPDNLPEITDVVVDIGTQLHECDYVVVKLTLHLPQSNYWQGLTGEFAGKVGVIQWNDMCDDQGSSGLNFLTSLNMHVLNGIADDSFKVYVDGTLVYNYVDNVPASDPELWLTHNIDLTSYAIVCGTNTVKIEATGDQWSSFDTYGQLAVDDVALFCDDGGNQYVDIGDTTSESGHNPVDWGPLEPSTSGGNYGGIDDCRCVWSADKLYNYATIDFNL